MRILLSALAIFCFSYANAQSKIKSEKLKEDFDYLITELRLQHQGLYNYVDKTQTDNSLDSIRAILDKPLTKLEFYEKLRYTIGLTNEAHTSIDLPKGAMLKFGISKSFLPLVVDLNHKELIVTQNFGKDIENLNKGVKIISVNGKDVNEILESLYPLIPTDGFNKTSQKEWVGGINFSLLYRLVYGKTKKFELQIQEFDNEKLKTVSIPAIRATSFKNKNAKFGSKSFDYGQFKFEQINDSIAYLSVPSFGNNDIDYADFYKSNFKKIDSLNIKHLIIDIQANGGGTEGNGNLLFSYLSNEVIQKYKRVTMLPKPYQKNKDDKGLLEDKWIFNDSIAQRGNYTLYSDYYSDLGYEKPDKDLIYNGKIYVLISGLTFSGAAEFSSLIRMSGRGVFIGEEGGGAYEGNVSGYSEYIKLPNSKIEVKIPTVHFQINVSPEIKGRGVMPDYTVPETWGNYLNGTNAKREFAIGLILNLN